MGKKIDIPREILDLKRLTHEEMKNLNRSITREEIESIMKNLPRKKRPGPDGFLVNSTEYLFEEEKMLPKLFYKARNTLIPKPDRDNTKREKYRPI